MTDNRQTMTTTRVHHADSMDHAREHADLCAACRLEARRALCRQTITLEGRPARVAGAREPVASAVFVDDGERATFAWGTVARAARVSPALVVEPLRRR